MKTQIVLILLICSVSLSSQTPQGEAPKKCFQSVANVLNNGNEGDPVLLEGVLYKTHNNTLSSYFFKYKTYI